VTILLFDGLFLALRKKIRIEDLLHSAGSYQSSPNVTSNLMNLVMQFRKVCIYSFDIKALAV